MTDERCLVCQILRHVDAKRLTLDQGIAAAMACGARVVFKGESIPYMCPEHKAMMKKMLADVGITTTTAKAPPEEAVAPDRSLS